MNWITKSLSVRIKKKNEFYSRAMESHWKFSPPSGKCIFWFAVLNMCWLQCGEWIWGKVVERDKPRKPGGWEPVTRPLPTTGKKPSPWWMKWYREMVDSSAIEGVECIAFGDWRAVGGWGREGSQRHPHRFLSCATGAIHWNTKPPRKNWLDTLHFHTCRSECTTSGHAIDS